VKPRQEQQMKNILLTSAICIMLAPPLLSQDKMRLAVLELEPKGVSKIIASSVSDLLRTEMVDTGQFIVVERAQMDSILKEQEIQMTGCTDSACAVQLGKLLSARKILIGEVNQMGSGVIITARVVDVEMGVADFASSEKAKDLNDIDRAAKRLAGKLTERITGKRVASVPSGMSEDIKNNIVYRASRVRIGLTMPGPIDPITDYVTPQFGPFNGALVDLFLYRMRNQDGNGLDFFIRGLINLYEIDNYSELGIGLKTIPAGYEFNKSELIQFAYGGGIRAIHGYYFADLLWQGYFLAYYQYSKGMSSVEYNYIGTLGPGYSSIIMDYKYTTHGIIGGAGIEIGISQYFAIFGEYTYGFNKISYPAKEKNLEGGAIRFGCTIRSMFL